MTRLLRLTFILISLLLATQVYAASTDDGLLEWAIIDGNNAIIWGFMHGTSTTTLTIPATVSDGVNTYSVTRINVGAFEAWNGKGEQLLTSVTIPDSVKGIEAFTFLGNQLTSVIIPNSVENIFDFAFGGNQLTTLTIPASVSYIESQAFSDNQLTCPAWYRPAASSGGHSLPQAPSVA